MITFYTHLPYKEEKKISICILMRYFKQLLKAYCQKSKIVSGINNSHGFPVDTRHRLKVYTSDRRLIDVETTSCVYWVGLLLKEQCWYFVGWFPCLWKFILQYLKPIQQNILKKSRKRSFNNNWRYHHINKLYCARRIRKKNISHSFTGETFSFVPNCRVVE